jgi:alcohol dehydrogenase class IV
VPSGQNLQCAKYYADIANLAFQGNHFDSQGGDVYEISEKFASLFEILATDLKIPRKLREVGIESNNIETLATEAMKQTRLLPNNPRVVTYEDALHLYEKAF